VSGARYVTDPDFLEGYNFKNIRWIGSTSLNVKELKTAQKSRYTSIQFLRLSNYRRLAMLIWEMSLCFMDQVLPLPQKTVVSYFG
jgi:hypothetical protein